MVLANAELALARSALALGNQMLAHDQCLHAMSEKNNLNFSFIQEHRSDPFFFCFIQKTDLV